MVKPITKCIKLLVLFVVLLLLVLVIWLHQGERSLNFAKPWLEPLMNPPNAPYSVAFGDITVHWGDLTKLGQLRISTINVAKRDGNVFAQFPEMYVTLDPLGFLPDRRFFHKMILHSPRLLMSRNASGSVQFGLEGAASALPMTELFSSITSDVPGAVSQSSALPFSEFIIDNAMLAFEDASSATKMVSTPFSLRLARHHGRYTAELAMPFDYEGERGRIDATLDTLRENADHVLNIELTKVPAKLLCVFGLCPDNIEGSGPVNGAVGLRLANDGTPLGVKVHITTKNAVLNAPQLFEKPIKLGESVLIAESDGATRTIHLTRMELALEDTNISASGTIRHPDDGWYVALEAKTDKLNMAKLYKYWPLVMAPDSRTWVTSKIKSGFGQNGVLKLNLTPADFSADYFSDAAVDARVDAVDIGFEYLPGFPEVQHMDGKVHFTGTTVMIEGGGGTLLTGTKITKATLKCPDLNHPKNPMETTFTVVAPAADAANLLALPSFVFDDAATLDAKKISGTVEASLALKFNSFSENKNTDPNAIHLDAVDYQIEATLKDVAQEGLFGGYRLHAIHGTFNASPAQTRFNGEAALADAGVADISFVQMAKKPLTVTVKNKLVVGKASNDFTVSYASVGAVPSVVISGKRLDLSQSYGSGGTNTWLKNFPAIDLEVNLAELLMAPAVPFTNVSGTLSCSRARCETAEFSAAVGKSTVTAEIGEEKGKRQLLVSANNAGQFLHALDVSDRMVGGKFQLKGTYNAVA